MSFRVVSKLLSIVTVTHLFIEVSHEETVFCVEIRLGLVWPEHRLPVFIFDKATVRVGLCSANSPHEATAPEVVRRNGIVCICVPEVYLFVVPFLIVRAYLILVFVVHFLERIKAFGLQKVEVFVKVSHIVEFELTATDPMTYEMV